MYKQPELWSLEGETTDEQYAIDILKNLPKEDRNAVLSGECELLGVDWKKFWRGVGKVASSGITAVAKKIKSNKKKKSRKSNKTENEPSIKETLDNAMLKAKSLSMKKKAQSDNTLLIGAGVAALAFFLLKKKG